MGRGNPGQAIRAIGRANPGPSWIFEGEVKDIRFASDDSNQIVVEVCPVPHRDPNAEGDHCISARWISPCIQGNSVVWIPPTVGDWCVCVSVNGDPSVDARVIGFSNGDPKPLPSGVDLDEAYIKLPDGMPATIQIDEVLVRIDGKDLTLTIPSGGKGTIDCSDIRLGSDTPSKEAARKGDEVDCGLLVYSSAAGIGVTPGTLVWTPPLGVAPSGPNSITLRGKIDQGSAKVKVED